MLPPSLGWRARSESYGMRSTMTRPAGTVVVCCTRGRGGLSVVGCMKAFGHHEPGLHATGCRGGGSFIIKYPFEFSYVPQSIVARPLFEQFPLGTTARELFTRKSNW